MLKGLYKPVHRTIIVQFCRLKSRQLLRKTSKPLREEIENTAVRYFHNLR